MLHIAVIAPPTALLFSVVFASERQLASFLAGRSEYSSTDHVVVKVTAVPGRMPDSALNKEVDAIGKRQIVALERMFKQVLQSSVCLCVFLVPGSQLLARPL